MAKKSREPSFNFGANVKPRSSKKASTSGKSKGKGKKSNTWASYSSGTGFTLPK
jgi:hypothetical protein